MVCLRESELLRSLLFHPHLPALSCEIHSHRLKKAHFFLRRNTKKAMVLSSNRRQSGSCSATASRSMTEDVGSVEESQCRPAFDLNLAVVLAGFAFEAYTTPPKDVGWREMDAAQCQTVFLSNSFVREVYDGQLFIKLRKGVDLPAMDPWGTSDPYVIFQFDGQVAKSNVKWATMDPTWNEDFTLNINTTTTKNLQIAVWDANLVTEHKRMGNGCVNLESLCDGNLHEVIVELEGIGGGGLVYLEVKYKTFNEIYEDKHWWRFPFVSDFILKSSLGSALRIALGSESLNASQFVQSAFGQLKLFNCNYVKGLPPSNNGKKDSMEGEESLDAVFSSNQSAQQEMFPPSSMLGHRVQEEKPVPLVDDAEGSNSLKKQKSRNSQQVEYFWKTFADIINQTVFQNLGISLPEIKSWERFDFLNKMGEQLRKSAEENYIESGLAISETRDENNVETGLTSTDGTPSSLSDMRKASRDLLSQTETIFGALVVLATTLSQHKNDSTAVDSERNNKNIYKKVGSGNEVGSNNLIKGTALDTKRAEEMRDLFSSAESAMEAWAMLATSLGRTSLIKSEFEKICFLDNVSTDTQVSIWRDSLRRRLVISFRGTEQSKWKDLLTDLMLLPAGLNPERLGVDFKQEVQVHGGFLNAYDSVRNRILRLIKLAMGFTEEDHLDIMQMWSVYVTGHSLGGALATLLALELSTSRMAKCGAISVTMYNFGSPRVGNRRFAEVYNEKVKNSWRVVNHRDIIPTVPRLMGYFHVAQPVYLAAGKLEKALLNQEFRGDGYDVDVIGEATPDVLVNEFMKGEKQFIEKILQTEINLLQSIRDGTALMQHMEDFYYITLLESVRSNYSV